MAYLYPWGNTQQLNLDWILQKIKDLEAGAGGADLDEISNALLAASYAAQAYEQFDIVFRDGKLYLANADIPAPGEAWTPAHWDEILLGGPVSALLKHVSNMSSDYVINDSQVTGDNVSDALDTLKNTLDTANSAITALQNGIEYHVNDTFTIKSTSSYFFIRTAL